MPKIKLVRCGNLLSVDSTPAIRGIFESNFTYNHRKFFRGYELKKREKQKRANPGSIVVAAFEDTRCRLFHYDDKTNKILCAAGLTYRIKHVFKQLQVGFEYEDMRHPSNLLPRADYSKLLDIPDLAFRHRQDEVLAHIESTDGGIICLPTGYGKTFIISLLARIYPTARIAVISPGLDLIKSTYGRLLEHAPNQVGRIGGGFHEPHERITLCSADSMHKLNMGEYQLILVDEVHSFATDIRLKALNSQYTDAKFVGFTASHNKRADGADAQLETIFGPVILDISYEEAEKHGVVTPIEVKFVPVRDGPETSSSDFQPKAKAYWRNHIRNQIIANTVNNIHLHCDVDDPQILIMVETVEHIFRLKQLLPDYEVVYANLQDSTREKLVAADLLDPEYEAITSQDREKLLKNFESGKLKKVIANHCWKQGIDPVHLNVFFRADGGTSAIANIQLPGRLSRKTDTKDSGLLLDCDDMFCSYTKRRSDKRKKEYIANGYRVV